MFSVVGLLSLVLVICLLMMRTTLEKGFSSQLDWVWTAFLLLFLRKTDTVLFKEKEKEAISVHIEIIL